ncbi:SO_0444 family Cu/Zn efflux transporter [Marinomonas sp. C1424]|uniref:SO_0444 family Cu/Zn efflux transporter n=2 Tax=Marinomonas transparens TaxID=2795388 RepID=A0A934JPD8_9GAMM|nr:SO_0444 family Cu/Zn efflux transporter [Marinomonas transparens]
MLFTESAPFLLAGMFIAGAINQLVPKKWIESTLGKSNSVVTAAFIGAPLPLCSCSVIPVAMGIRRSGASKASTASFLVSTPETGVDSIGVTYALMGPLMAIARPISAILSAIMAGSLIALFGSKINKNQINNSKSADTQNNDTSEKAISSCCHKKTAKPKSLFDKVKASFVFGYGQLLRDFMVWFLIGIFFAAVVTTFVPENFLTQYGQGVFAMLVIVLISVPMYICATASTPLAVGLLLSGITPGAALVFMLTGPATNIATLMVIKNELGKRELALYLIAVVVSAVSCGLLLDYLFDVFQWKLQLTHGDHSDMVGALYQASAIILAGLILFQLQKRYLKIPYKSTH